MKKINLNNERNLAGDIKKTIKSKKKTALFLLAGLTLIILILLIGNLMLTYSGSNEWEVELETKELTIYSLKEPGIAEKKYKITKKFNLTLNQVVSAMLDPSLEQCAAWDPNCFYSKAIEEFSETTLSGIHIWRMWMGHYFLPREFLLKTQLSQDPESKSVLIQFTSVLDNEYVNDCCARVESNISWRYTPIGNGVLEIDYLYDLKFGGFFPAVLANEMVPEMLYRFFVDELEGLLNVEKYKNAEKLSFIIEENDAAISK